MIRAIFDIFVFLCIAFGLMFGIVFFPMLKHFFLTFLG